MNLPMMLVEAILAGFFAVACVRACEPSNPNGKLHLSDLLRFPGRLERLQRTRWQWFSMVALLLVVRLQAGLPLVLEIIVAVEFVVFLALPARAEIQVEKKVGVSMRPLWEVADFVRSIRRQMRFGELSRAPLQLLRVEFARTCATVECDWIARPADTWDSNLRPSA